MLKVYQSAQFKKDYKRMMKRGYKEEEFKVVLGLLMTQQKLPKEYHDHELKGNYKGFRECHINPDWLLMYEVKDDILTLVLIRTGTHSDLFKK